jgi:hypothetical protein
VTRWDGKRSVAEWPKLPRPSSTLPFSEVLFGSNGAKLGGKEQEAVGIGGGLGVTPGVALVYAVVAAGFFTVGRLGASTVSISHPEMLLAAPAE